MLQLLKKNLLLVGWNINHKENGIILPKYWEDIFWHDLPVHCGYNGKHKDYNIEILSQLDDQWKSSDWKDYCSDEDTKHDEDDLKNGIQKFIDRIRNKIIRWDQTYYLNPHSDKRGKSFTRAGYPSAPGIKKKRVFPDNDT